MSQSNDDRRERLSHRRSFLQTAARWAAAIGLGALVARLAGRAVDGTRTAGPQDVCRRCAALRACNRPDGVRTRDALGLAGGHSRVAPDSSAEGAGGHAGPPLHGNLGLCGAPPDGELVSRWVRREDA